MWALQNPDKPTNQIIQSGSSLVILQYIAEKNNWAFQQAMMNINGVSTAVGAITLQHGSRFLPSRIVFAGEVINSYFVIDSSALEAVFGARPGDPRFTHQMGDRFTTMESAALAWGLTYNAKSIELNLEFASWLYTSSEDERVFWNDVAVGTLYEVNLPPPYLGTAWPTGDIHSHGAYNFHLMGDVFSDEDIDGFYRVSGILGSSSGVPYVGFLTTPAGYLLRYDTIDSFQSMVTNRLPSDPHHPNNTRR